MTLMTDIFVPYTNFLPITVRLLVLASAGTTAVAVEPTYSICLVLVQKWR